MMTYVMSDLHGEYDKYLSMLDKIKFSDDDDLYILGDVVDRGQKPVEILRDMSMRHNVFPIMGNHDKMAIDVLSWLLDEVNEEKLYKNMVDAKAPWLYELPQWNDIFDEEKRKDLYREAKRMHIIVMPEKIGRNDPCPCGSGRKFKQCHGRNGSNYYIPDEE